MDTGEVKIHTLGICVGASTVSAVQLAYAEDDRAKAEEGGRVPSPAIVRRESRSHGGNPSRVLQDVLSCFDLSSTDRLVVTGRRFRHSVNLSSISEPEAVEQAYHYVKPPDISSPAIVSCGGETFMAYVLDGTGRIANVLTGNKCASGTGEFFLQQLKRMAVSVEDMAAWSNNIDPYLVSGRCSVFCKSDCTHAVNKGAPKERVVAGLCRMMAGKVLELVKHINQENIILVGGCANNRIMVDYLENRLPGLIVPDTAACFEALGAALWAGNHETAPFPGFDRLLQKGGKSFDSLPSLAEYKSMVGFKEGRRADASAGEKCVLGLDVGSTTTKAVLVRWDDNAILASVYLYTHGDPVAASRACYARLRDQIDHATGGRGVSIAGLGVCGSGRQIAGLHALTDGVVNEIIAHAEAAVYFDPDVDTLFEIGGQDAKYTYIKNGVPAAYAMNEACSAGTGSFLAESAEEVLGVPVSQIADTALAGDAPANFNDQCAAFIGSDIKRAVQEGVKHENIVAGLVYSICQNYINRVKGNRPVGAKIFMQGGVCYNHAVPRAMASVCGKPIVVPPEPGLMGAFGAALENKKRIRLGLLKEQEFDLAKLADREVEYKEAFVCKGGRENCDRACQIAVLELAGQTYPFGGACNRYYNQRKNIRFDVDGLDLVRQRERMIFREFASASTDENAAQDWRGRVGLSRSFMMASYYPFYNAFFRQLGYLPEPARFNAGNGADKCNAAFCYPAEQAHEYFFDLLRRRPPLDFIFTPRLRGIPGTDHQPESQTCPFVQAEPYYLSTTFRKKLDELKKNGTSVLQPYINMTNGLNEARKPLLDTARRMGSTGSDAKKAFAVALEQQRECFDRMRRTGKDLLKRLEKEPDSFAVVVFGRPYNAFVENANMGIPHKIATRGLPVLPFDFLPIEKEYSKEHMYWGMGQRILQGARFVKNHPALYPIYITNFSCGVDSFLIGYFRDIMGEKPYLTLELDSHTADAGIETRIEAFLDVVAAYRNSLLARENSAASSPTPSTFKPAETIIDKTGPRVVSSSGEVLSMRDPRVKLLIPSMGRLSAELVRAVFRSGGYHLAEHPPADENVLKLGRAHTSCKECLPLILTTGKLLNYSYSMKKNDEIVIYFMPSASGPCRFGQYAVFMQDLIAKLQIENVAVLSLNSNNFYYGMDGHFDYFKGWWAIVIADLMEDARAMILANARDVGKGLKMFEQQWRILIKEMEEGTLKTLQAALTESALALARIPMRKPPDEVPKIILTGEIFVRRDGFSRQYLTERLAAQGFAVRCTPISEWLNYLHYNAGVNREDHRIAVLDRLKYFFRSRIMHRQERKIENAMALSGLINGSTPDIKTIVANASSFISPRFSGEAILTTGGGLAEVASDAAGVIVIGPFGCMPHRISEAIMSEVMTAKDKLRINPDNEQLQQVLADIERLPFLAIETDGSPYPQLVEARLEAFCLQARRLHEKMLACRK